MSERTRVAFRLKGDRNDTDHFVEEKDPQKAAAQAVKEVFMRAIVSHGKEFWALDCQGDPNLPESWHVKAHTGKTP